MKYATKDKLLALLIHISIGILGAWLLFNPKSGINMFRFYIGIILLISAIAFGIIYFRSKERDIIQLIQAIIAAVLGVIFLLSGKVTSVFLGVILMIWILFEGISKIRMSFIYKKFEFNYWWVLLIYGIAAVALGVYLLFNLSLSGSALVSLVGLFLLVRSIIEVFDNLLYKEVYYKALENKKEETK